MSHRISVYESTPKKLDPSQNSTRAAQCPSTAPADWEEVYHPGRFVVLLYSHKQLHLHHLSLRSTTVGCKMDLQRGVITVNNLKQRHRRDTSELHILPFHGFTNFLSKSGLEHTLQLKRTLTTAKA